MQTLYALELHKTNTNEEGLTVFNSEDAYDVINKGYRLLNDKFDKSSELFTLVLFYLTRIALYVETDAHQRASKYLPTEEDLKVNTKIAGNLFLWELLDNQSFQQCVKKYRTENRVDVSFIKNLYQKLSKTDEYKEYILTESRDFQSEKKIMHMIWRQLMLNNSTFQEYISDEFLGWEDDKDMIIMLVENYFSNSKKVNFNMFISTEKQHYAKELLKTTIEKDLVCIELIKTILKNWDTERVAQIDLIAIKMGLCELLYFPTIPVKVTINEYIEISKMYSTPQSGQFVNGVLDNLLKKLMVEDKIHKKDRVS